jgi:hypothetical protein
VAKDITSIVANLQIYVENWERQPASETAACKLIIFSSAVEVSEKFLEAFQLIKALYRGPVIVAYVYLTNILPFPWLLRLGQAVPLGGAMLLATTGISEDLGTSTMVITFLEA